MADPSAHEDADAESGVESRQASRPSTPPWVQLLGVAAIVVLVLLAVLILAGHGPGRHAAGAPSKLTGPAQA